VELNKGDRRARCALARSLHRAEDVDMSSERCGADGRDELGWEHLFVVDCCWWLLEKNNGSLIVAVTES
jgi:hypothetical protein